VPGPDGVKAPPEFKPRKDPSAIKSTHEALDRVHEQELKLYEYKKGVFAGYEKEFGRRLPLSEPVHPLDAKGAAFTPTLDTTQCRALVGGLSVLPMMLGLETRPPQDAADQLAAALSDLSKHYPQLESKILDWVGVGVAASVYAGPWVVEARARKAGEWDHKVRPEFEKAGLVAPRLQS
jgi:hypothetical protein